MEPRWVITSSQFFPVAIDYWESHKVFLVASYHEGRIAMFGDDGVERNFFGNAFGKKLHNRLYRLAIDQVSQRLWVLGSEGITIYELPSGKVERHFWIWQTTPNSTDCLPDLALDNNGTAYISDVGRSNLFRISGETLSVDELKVAKHEAALLDAGFSSLSVLDDGTLLGGNAASGRIWRVDTRTSKATELLKDERLIGVCSLTIAKGNYAAPSSYRAQKIRLYAATGFSGGVVEIGLTKEAEAMKAGITGFRSRSQVAIGINAFMQFLILADSQLWHHSDFGGTHQVSLPFKLFVFGLPFPHNPHASCRSWHMSLTKRCSGI